MKEPAAQSLVIKANQDTDIDFLPEELLPRTGSFHRKSNHVKSNNHDTYTQSGPQSQTQSTIVNVSFEYFTIKSIPAKLMEWAFKLVESNMKQLYDRCDGGFNPTAKRNEMSEPTARYIIVSQTNLENSLEKKPIAFVYFQFTLEATIEEDENGDDVMMEVVYCYEIQVHPNYHGYGIGSYLMSVLEKLGKNYHMKKIMLTVFKENKTALKFYVNSLGYQVDEISPSMTLSPEEAETYGYEILSKNII